ncbi:MAG: tryptophan 2,3-dioxygenase family protein [Flavobacteriaceae bacterium]
MTDTTKKITAKYEALGEKPETYLQGLLHSKPINYWDYIEVNTLLSLQRPRTDFKDETIFIMYHQLSELVLKMMCHELEQIADHPSPDENFLIKKLKRLNRYTSLLITSFDIMKEGMDYEDYNVFRTTLTPASGFQSVQFRYIELYCTSLKNLINEEGQKRLPSNPSVETYFEHIYWKDAGLNRKTGKKTLTMQQFEDEYLEDLTAFAKHMKNNTLEDKLKGLEEPSTELVETLREFDHLYNVQWPMVHLSTAEHYLNKHGEEKAATGGSKWKKYLHPKYQQRKFFPSLWTAHEKNTWGSF